MQALHRRHKGRQVVTVEVVACVQAQARLRGGYGRINVLDGVSLSLPSAESRAEMETATVPAWLAVSDTASIAAFTAARPPEICSVAVWVSRFATRRA